MEKAAPFDGVSLTAGMIIGVGVVTTVDLSPKDDAHETPKKSGGVVEGRLAAMGITLKEPPSPKGNYVSCVPIGDKMLHTAGHIPQTDTGVLIKGKVGQDLTKEQGYDAAKWCAVNICATLKKELGDLDRVKRIVKVVGFVNSTDSFTAQPAVINGASDFFGAVFKEKGVHSRSAVSSNSLPLGIATEVECIVEYE